MKNKVIDIIIPLYNSLDSLKWFLDSINIQTYNNIVNIYLVDDGDNNDYTNIIKEYDSLDITYLRYDTNKGPGYARQYGFDKTFEFIKNTNYSKEYLSIYVYTRFLYLNRIFDILPDNYRNKGVEYYNIYNKYLNQEDLKRVYELNDFIDYYKKNTNNC